jgi:hypothetical protein
VAVRQLGVAPSEFWTMRPRHWWWLVETLDDRRRGARLSEDDRREFADWLRGADMEW